MSERHLPHPDVVQSRYIIFYPTPLERQQIPPVFSTFYTAAVPEALHAHTLGMDVWTAVSQLSTKNQQFNGCY